MEVTARAATPTRTPSARRVRAGARESDATTSLAGRAATFAVLVVALTIIGVAAGDLLVVAVGGASLWVGVALAEAPPVRGAVGSVPGFVIGAVMAVVLAVGWGVLEGEGHVEGAVPGTLLLVGLVGAGLDLPRAGRARGYVLASGFVVLPLAGEGDGVRLLLAAVWLAAALATLGVLRRDRLSAWTHAAPVRPPEERSTADEVVGPLLLALGVAAIAALLFSVVDVRDWFEGDSGPGSGGFGSFEQDLSDAGPRSSEDGSSSPGSGSGSSGAGSGTPEIGAGPGSEGQVGGEGSSDLGSSPGDPNRTGSDSSGESFEARWILLALVVAAAVGAALWWFRREARPTAASGLERWPLELAARLGREGARRGRPRRPGETVIAYAGALTDGPLPDGRLVAVGAVISEGLFGRRPVPPDRQAWAAHVLDEVGTMAEVVRAD